MKDQHHVRMATGRESNPLPRATRALCLAWVMVSGVASQASDTLPRGSRLQAGENQKGTPRKEYQAWRMAQPAERKALAQRHGDDAKIEFRDDVPKYYRVKGSALSVDREVDKGNIEQVGRELIAKCELRRVADRDLKVTSKRQVGSAHIVRFAQFHRGMKVLLSGITVEVWQGKLDEYVSKVYDDIDIAVHPRDWYDARFPAVREAFSKDLSGGCDGYVDPNHGKQLFVVPLTPDEGGGYRVCWRFYACGRKVFVDAETGRLVRSHSAVDYGGTIVARAQGDFWYNDRSPYLPFYPEAVNVSLRSRLKAQLYAGAQYEGTALQSTYTDATGLVRFEDLPPGTYTVRIDNETERCRVWPQVLPVRQSDGTWMDIGSALVSTWTVSVGEGQTVSKILTRGIASNADVDKLPLLVESRGTNLLHHLDFGAWAMIGVTYQTFRLQTETGTIEQIEGVSEMEEAVVVLTSPNGTKNRAVYNLTVLCGMRTNSMAGVAAGARGVVHAIL